MPTDIIITGIPRSGTSYLCTILNEVKNVVVINEPDEVFQLMQNDSSIPLSKYYEAVRERINNNLPIKNKIVDGKFIEDTNVVDVFSDYIPDVKSSDFLLGTKNTLIYLNSLDRLSRYFKNNTVVACVRHPIDTIASWKNVSIPHLRNADPEFLLRFADENGKKAVNRVLQKSNTAQRYAMWWDYLAKVVYKNNSNLTVVRYEDMVAAPQVTVNNICDSASFSVNMRKTLEPSLPRSHKDTLDNETIGFINQYCKNSAAKLGYKL